jgi:hypothetical protein
LPTKPEEIRQWIIGRVLDESGENSISGIFIPQKAVHDGEIPPANLYRVVWEHLLTAEHLLKTKDAEQRRLGMGIAVQALRESLTKLNDLQLAMAIADNHILENLDAADRPQWEWLSKPRVLEPELIPKPGVFGHKEMGLVAWRTLSERQWAAAQQVLPPRPLRPKGG